jgi:hypothetical protein
MTRIRTTGLCTLAVLLLTLPVQPARAQGGPPPKPDSARSQAEWFDVPQPPRQNVEVLTIDGNWHKGRLRLLTGDAIIFESERPPIRRDDVWQVWAGGKPSWAKRGFWIGFATCAVGSIATYATQGDCADPTSACARDGYFSKGDTVGLAVVGGAIVGGLGALLGRLIGGPGRDPALAYTGPTRRPSSRTPDGQRRVPLP